MDGLRLVKWFISHRLHTGACVNLVLLTYLLMDLIFCILWFNSVILWASCFEQKYEICDSRFKELIIL